MTVEQKIKYVCAYIHFMKSKHVRIAQPKTQEQLNLLNHCYHSAVNEMTRRGKKIKV